MERERPEEKREKVIEELKPGLAVCLRCRNKTEEDEEKEDIRSSTGREKEGIAKRNDYLSIL